MDSSYVSNLCNKVVQLLLCVGILLGHLLVLLLPLIAGSLQCLDFSLVVAGLYICLAKAEGALAVAD